MKANNNSKLQSISRKTRLLSTFAGVMACVASAQAQATVVNINFEESEFADVGLFVNSDTVVYKDVKFSALSLDNGLSGALIDGSDPFTFFNLGFPGNNLTSYYAALNNGMFSLVHSNTKRAIKLISLDFSFIAPLPGFINFSVGQLVVAGKAANGSYSYASRDFTGQDIQGNWQFSNWGTIASELNNKQFSEISVFACLYTNNGQCVIANNNQGQFAVDNLAVDVAEPATIGVFGLALAGLFAANRRRQIK